MDVDLNHGSGFVYGRTAPPSPGERINGIVDAVLAVERDAVPPRDYLGGSRIGDPCARRLVYELMRMPPDTGRGFEGVILRVFEAGHRFEDLTIRWLRAAGFDLRTRRRDGGQFGFSVAGGRLRGHIDGVLVDGPDVGIAWPALWEHKALRRKAWEKVVKEGLRQAKPVYWAQVQLYMAYLELSVTLFTVMNKDSQELWHEVVAYDAAEAQALSDKAVAVIRAAKAGQLLPRIADTSDHWICRFCPFIARCWSDPA